MQDKQEFRSAQQQYGVLCGTVRPREARQRVCAVRSRVQVPEVVVAPLQAMRDLYDKDRLALQLELDNMSVADVVSVAVEQGRVYQRALSLKPTPATCLTLQHSQDMLWLCAARVAPGDLESMAALKMAWTGLS